MADERDDSQKTEEPTQRRLDEALKQGDVVKSNELSTFVMMAAAALVLTILAQNAARQFTREFVIFLQDPGDMVIDETTVMVLLKQCVYNFFGIFAPFAGFMILAALGGHLIQHRPFVAPSRLMPDISKISPLTGFKRLYGLDGWVNLLKGLLKASMVGVAAFMAIWPERSKIVTAGDLTPAGIAALALSLIGKVLLAALIVIAAIAAFDYFFQRQRFLARHRMTRQELKDEVKQNEGDPQIKAKIRQIRFERSKKRMMSAIPEATVVITNPTHYAVALKYESGKMGAPVCVAKGMDHLALTIRRKAEEHEVPIVENPPLARALYAAIEVDDEIPSEHYKAVAQVIGYVMRVAKERTFWRH